ncbi:hypothetical protein SBRY_10523 [Actinacidiphila bryophytorum]|uniref:Uncharacterized protein n=1 Tax=Actinacidiphila bryophytorum TaxID=1436133 RepID=A0A9W4ECH5_9ACTN|nr:hypothetical protein SBRY_10523 [Actinacidiphila bryophytorum]
MHRDPGRPVTVPGRHRHPGVHQRGGLGLRQPERRRQRTRLPRQGHRLRQLPPVHHLARHRRRDDLVHQLGRLRRQHLVQRRRPPRPLHAVTARH